MIRIGNLTFKDGAVLGPMAGVTDCVMRFLCGEQGCSWTVSEMLSAKGYVYSPQSRAHTDLLRLIDGEAPCALQLFGSDEYYVSEAAKRLEERPFAFFDFNMGCPARKIVSGGEGSALMREPLKAGRILNALVKAVKKPVTVKIRSGWDKDSINAVEIARIAEDSGVAAITVHARTRDSFYSGTADRSIISQVKQAVKIPVIGNGDIFSGEDAVSMLKETGCDAVMAARGAQGNPWLFKEIQCALSGKSYTPPTVADRVLAALRHFDMECALMGEYYAVPEMRKHIAWYLRGAPGSSRLRAEVNTLTSRGEVAAKLYEYLNTYNERDTKNGKI